MRSDGRSAADLRPMRIHPGWLDFAHGSALIECGRTRVLCTAMIEEKVPRWRMSSGEGWVTAEYSMLPGSTSTRTTRAVEKGRPDGRSTEIQRLIGRALRSIVDMKKLGPRALWIDCDVLQADGGTRTAAINGGFVALALACRRLVTEGSLPALPLCGSVQAISAGVVRGEAMLDLPYDEDSNADVDMNFVVTGAGELIEVQGTGERTPFTRDTMARLTDLALAGCQRVRAAQQEALGVDFGSFGG
jgi:ribonuclease PH